MTVFIPPDRWAPGRWLLLITLSTAGCTSESLPPSDHPEKRGQPMQRVELRLDPTLAQFAYHRWQPLSRVYLGQGTLELSAGQMRWGEQCAQARMTLRRQYDDRVLAEIEPTDTACKLHGEPVRYVGMKATDKPCEIELSIHPAIDAPFATWGLMFREPCEDTRAGPDIEHLVVIIEASNDRQ